MIIKNCFEIRHEKRVIAESQELTIEFLDHYNELVAIYPNLPITLVKVIEEVIRPVALGD